MNKDSMSEIVKILGVEIDERFNIIINTDTRASYDNCYFSETVGGSISLFNCNDVNIGELLSYLFIGSWVIEKIPFKPKIGKEYWYWSVGSNKAVETEFFGFDFDFAMLKIGNCFRTKEEAEIKGKKLMENILKEYK